MTAKPGPLLLVLAACHALPACAAPGVCSLPDVLDTVAQQMRATGLDAIVDSRSVGEVTTPGNPVSACAVWALETRRDTNLRPGPDTAYDLSIQRFQVQRRANSLVVELTGPPEPHPELQTGPGGRFPAPGTRP